MLLIGLFYITLPLLLLGLIAFKHQPKILSWVITIISFGSVIIYLWATARWDLVSIYIRPIFPVLFLIASVVGYKRIKKPEKPQNKIVIIMAIALNLAVIVFISGLNWFSFKGYATPENVIDLASPFHSGRQIVLHGGTSPFTNGHFHVKPQNYALDIVGLNKLGMRSTSISGGTDLENYVIFGESVYSPIDGKILIVVDKYADLIPPKSDVENIAGNHILIESNGVEIILAHFKKGSIVVKVGDIVTTNTLLGQVGNTGNTSEPHLHIHAEKGDKANTILNGIAIPFTINKQYLVRGDVIKFEKEN